MASFWVDTSPRRSWRERTDPSLQALDEEAQVRAEIKDERLDVRIVWLTEPTGDLERSFDAIFGVFEENEAIAVTPHLGRFALARPIGMEREASDA